MSVEASSQRSPVVFIPLGKSGPSELPPFLASKGYTVYFGLGHHVQLIRPSLRRAFGKFPDNIFVIEFKHSDETSAQRSVSHILKKHGGVIIPSGFIRF